MRTLVVDDHPIFVFGLLALLREVDPDGVWESAASLSDCVARHQNATFELVLLDMNLPGIGYLDALGEIRRMYPDAEVVVISAEDRPELIYKAIDAGASGYIPKYTEPEQTKHALRLVQSGGVYLPKALMHRLVPAVAKRGPSVGAQLSARQFEVLRLLNEGLPNKSIARQLDIAEGTVKAHLSAIFNILNVQTRLQAMKLSNELGLIPSDVESRQSVDVFPR